MNNKYFLHVTSFEKKIFSGQIKKLFISGIEGELGIFPGHAPLLTIIKPGMIRIFQDKNTEKVIYLSGGILEVQPYEVIVLVDIAIKGEKLDEIKTLKIKKKAEKNIKKIKNKDIYKKNNILLSEAIAKLQIISFLKQKDKK